MTGHFKKIEKTAPTEKDAFIFQQLIDLLKPSIEYLDLECKANTARHYELWTTDGFRARSLNPRTGRGIQFAAVIVHRKFITFYFHPLYTDKQLKTKLTDSLRSLLKGETCFHIKELTDEMIHDFKNLIKLGWESYKELRLVKVEMRFIQKNPLIPLS